MFFIFDIYVCTGDQITGVWHISSDCSIRVCLYIYMCVCFQLTYPNLLYLLCIYMQYIHIFNICLGYFEDCLGIRSTLWTSNLYKLLAVSPCRSL